MEDHKRLVRRGYNAIANDYLAARTAESADIKLLDDFMAHLPEGALVLDAGCGAGVPISRILQNKSRVVGVDFAETQLGLARRLVPDASFVCQDLTALGFAPNCFDAICSYYAIIHIPRQEHEALFRRFRHILKPGGLAFLCLGANDLAMDMNDDYFGVPMHWSHYDAKTNLALIEKCGLHLVWSRLIPDSHWPHSSHLFVLAQKPS